MTIWQYSQDLLIVIHNEVYYKSLERLHEYITSVNCIKFGIFFQTRYLHVYASIPPGQSQAFDTHAVSYQNITTRKVLLEEKQIGSFVMDRNKL